MKKLTGLDLADSFFGTKSGTKTVSEIVSKVLARSSASVVTVLAQIAGFSELAIIKNGGFGHKSHPFRHAKFKLTWVRQVTVVVGKRVVGSR